MRISVVTALVCVIVSGLLLGLAALGGAQELGTGAEEMQVISRVGTDLVIQEIRIRELGSTEFYNARVSVRVRNIGGTNAGPSMTVLLYSRDATATPIVLAQATPAIPGNGYHELDFVVPNLAGDFQGMLLAVADAPVAGHPTGQVSEGPPVVMMAATAERPDLNNTFGVIFTTRGRSMPFRFQNPAVR